MERIGGAAQTALLFRNMSDDDPNGLDWARFFLRVLQQTAGFGMMGAIFYTQYFLDKDVNLMLYSIPAALMGIDLDKLRGLKK